MSKFVDAISVVSDVSTRDSSGLVDSIDVSFSIFVRGVQIDVVIWEFSNKLQIFLTGTNGVSSWYSVDRNFKSECTVYPLFGAGSEKGLIMQAVIKNLVDDIYNHRLIEHSTEVLFAIGFTAGQLEDREFVKELLEELKTQIVLHVKNPSKDPKFTC